MLCMRLIIAQLTYTPKTCKHKFMHQIPRRGGPLQAFELLQLLDLRRNELVAGGGGEA